MRFCYFGLLIFWGGALFMLELALRGHCSAVIGISRSCKLGWKGLEFACGAICPNLRLWTMDEPLLIQGRCFLVYSEAFFGSIGWQNLQPLGTNHLEYLSSWSEPVLPRSYLWFLVDFGQHKAWTQKCIRRQWSQVHNNRQLLHDCICTLPQAPCIQASLKCR